METFLWLVSCGSMVAPVCMIAVVLSMRSVRNVLVGCFIAVVVGLAIASPGGGDHRYATGAMAASGDAVGAALGLGIAITALASAASVLIAWAVRRRAGRYPRSTASADD